MSANMEQLKLRNTKLSRILEVGRIMSTQSDLHKLLEIIVKETSSILEADRTSLFIYNDKHKELWLMLTEKQEIKEIRFGVDKGIAGFVARNRQVMNIEDAYSHDLFNPEIDQKTGFKTESMLCAPLENLEGKLIGVVQVLNKKNGIFSDEDVEVLPMFSSLAAILLENSILAKENLQKDRMAMVGNMASTIIHDIKNPMTCIKGLAEIIAVDTPDNKQHTDMILKSVDRVMNMSEELLEFSKGIESNLQFQKTNCMEFFEDTFSLVVNELKDSDIRFKTLINYNGDIEVNQDKIQRAIYNIIGNARDAMAEGGSLEITVSEAENKKNLMLKFTDNGKGMPAEILETLFDPFVTFGKKNGTGLGMAITKKIIDAHDGYITVSSEEGKGTEIAVTLPKYH